MPVGSCLPLPKASRLRAGTEHTGCPAQLSVATHGKILSRTFLPSDRPVPASGHAVSKSGFGDMSRSETCGCRQTSRTSETFQTLRTSQTSRISVGSVQKRLNSAIPVQISKSACRGGALLSARPQKMAAETPQCRRGQQTPSPALPIVSGPYNAPVGHGLPVSRRLGRPRRPKRLKRFGRLRRL